MGSISCHITPLVISSLGARTHTHTQTHTHKHTHMHTGDPQKINFKKPGVCWPARAWFKNFILSYHKPLGGPWPTWPTLLNWPCMCYFIWSQQHCYRQYYWCSLIPVQRWKYFKVTSLFVDFTMISLSGHHLFVTGYCTLKRETWVIHMHYHNPNLMAQCNLQLIQSGLSQCNLQLMLSKYPTSSYIANYY